MTVTIDRIFADSQGDLDAAPFAVVWFNGDTVEFDITFEHGLHPIQALLALDDIGAGRLKVIQGMEQHRFAGHPCLLLVAEDTSGPVTKALTCGLTPFQARAALRAMRLYADWLFEGAFQANLQMKMNRQPGLFVPGGLQQ